MSVSVCLEGITKTFGRVVANDHIDLELNEGEIHALLGENGAGKTTLMNVLFGLYKPDAGAIYVRGRKVELRSPRDAIALGIGMVHQHFMLIPSFTAAENVILGTKAARGLRIDLSQAVAKLSEMSLKYNLAVDPQAVVKDMSMGSQQRVEVLKALYRGARILIMDEPTAVLTPQEADELGSILRALARDGATVVFITHKLDEVMSISDRVTVLRDGKKIGTVDTSSTTKKSLACMMVGREVSFNTGSRGEPSGKPVLEVSGLTVLGDRGIPRVKDVSFKIMGGEILGVAGVDGNGQSELAEALTGLRPVVSGRVEMSGKDITHASPKKRLLMGMGHIPQDRRGRGLVLSLPIADNAVLETFDTPEFSRRGLLRFGAIREHARRLIKEYDVRCPGEDAAAGSLSGGNQQKLILARELSRNPSVLVAVQPTWGLDVGATEFVRRQLLAQKERGTSILLISTELDEIISLSDRIAVMFEGRITGIVTPDSVTLDQLGMMMAGETARHIGVEEAIV